MEIPELQGTIVEVQRRTAVVAGDDGGERHCQYSPTIDLSGFSNFAVGDRVSFLPMGSQQEPIIIGIEPRRSKISRPGPKDRAADELILAANVDVLLVVASSRQPEFNPRLIDRYLALAELFELDAVLCMNKSDLDADEPPELAYLRSLGYPVVICSAKTGAGLDELREALRDLQAVLSGPSGVGKSSLIKALVPGVDPRVGEVRKGDGKGRHTTTSSHLYRTHPGIRLIDTPGIRELGIWQASRKELSYLWRDFRPFAERCKFRDCEHKGEPECAVAEAVKSGALPGFRLESYLRVLESLPA